MAHEEQQLLIAQMSQSKKSVIDKKMESQIQMDELKLQAIILGLKKYLQQPCCWTHKSK
jgi:hypothetical protein